MIDLGDWAKRKARGLTADQKQKISLGRGLVRSDVNAILFDEPLTVIDPHMKWVLRSQLKQLHRQFGFTMVYVTHDQTEALTFADKVVVMYDGEIVQIGTPAELFERPSHTFVGYFIGSPGMNVMPATIDGADRLGRRRRRCRSAARRRSPPATRSSSASARNIVRLGREGMPVSISKVEDIGRQKIVRASFAGQPIAIVVARGRRDPGRAAASRFDPAGINIYADSWRVEQGGLSHGQDLEQQGLVSGAAGAGAGRLLGRHPADDGGQLFGAGHVRQQRVLLGRHRLVRARCCIPTASGRRWSRNLIFSFIILAIEIPLGIFIALNMPKKGLGRAGLPGADGAAAADPVERRRHDLAGVRPRRHRPARPYARGDRHRLQLRQDPFDAWVTVIVMDVWHWTSLVVLLCYAGLVSIPDAYYQAAKIDGASRWAVFRYIQLPKMKRVLLIAVLLRFMDSFMIYTEPFVVTGGGPGNSTTFLSIDLVKMAVGQFDLGPAAAMSIVYFLIILLLSWVFYTVMTKRATQNDVTKAGEHDGGSAVANSSRLRSYSWIVPTLYIIFLLLPIYWLVNMSFKTNAEIIGTLLALAAQADARQLHGDLHRSVLV